MAFPVSGRHPADLSKAAPSRAAPSKVDPSRAVTQATQDSRMATTKAVKPAGSEGWEVSNETANEAGAPAAGTGQDEDAEGAEADGSEGGGDAQIDALARALGELDGEILDERVSAAATPGRSGGAGNEPKGNAVPAPPIAEPSVPQPPTPLPPDQPDARDDDVVARQLREAAMAETDPELREQLWEEYRRYKSGL